MDMFFFWHLSGVLVDVIDSLRHSRLFLQRLFFGLKNPSFWLSHNILFLRILAFWLFLWLFYSILSVVLLLLITDKEMGYKEIGRIFLLAIDAASALLALAHMV